MSVEPKTQPPQKQEVPIQHEVTVTLKLVQVYVTDREGKPVPDLLPTDFKLFDNGKPVTITEFEKHTLLIPGEPGEKQETPSQPGSPRLSRRFFLFFDFAFNNPQGLEQAKRAALHFLGNQAQASDEIGVLSYSIYKGLTLHEYLTTDHQKVREVVEGFSLKDVLGRAQNLEAEYWNAMKDLIGESHMTAPKTVPDGWLNPAKQKLLDLSVDRMNYQLHARNFTQKMGALAKSLRLIPGYKYIILFSSGIAGSIFQGGPGVIDRSKLETAQRAGNATLYNMDSLDAAIWEEKKYENMIKELAQANCPVFVFNTEQLGQDPSFNKAMSGEYPLKRISKISGGEYFPHVEDYESNLDQVQNMTGMYYVLGYPIGEKEDGKFHEIKVRVQRKDCEVRAQGGYFDPKPFREYSEFEKTIHLLDVALTENPQLQSPAGFPMTALACPTDKEPLLVLLSRIPKEIFASGGKGQNEVVSLILDDQKNIVNFKRATVNFAGIAQPSLCHYTFSLLPPGDYDCRVVVRNLETGQTAVASESVLIPSASDVPLTLLPPLLLRPEADTYYFGVQKRKESDVASSTPSLTAIYPFEPKEFSPWLGELPAGSPKVYAMVVCGLGDISEPELELSFFLKEDPSGEEIPIPHSVLSAKPYSRDEGEKSWLALLSQLEFSGLKPGPYILKVTARETTTKSEAESVQKLNVR
jgi:VWFA-related protein